MEVILRKNATDSEMLDVITKNFQGDVTLWAVVHQDFIKGDSVFVDEMLERGNEVFFDLEYKIKA